MGGGGGGGGANKKNWGGDPFKYRKLGKEPDMSHSFFKGDGILSNGLNYILYNIHILCAVPLRHQFIV